MTADDAFATFLFADLAGFTALTEAHGDEHAADLAGDFCEWVAALAPRFSGERIKNIGDAVMLRCEDPGAAIALGLEIVEGFAARPQSPTVRVGIHSGPAVQRGGDWFGSTINLAARVSAAAAGGEVLLTGSTAELVATPGEFKLQMLGPRDFRNVLEPVSILRAQRCDEDAAEREIDPVCRMAIPPGESVGSLTYAGTRYGFCSLECARQFASAPDRYLDAGRSG